MLVNDDIEDTNTYDYMETQKRNEKKKRKEILP